MIGLDTTAIIDIFKKEQSIKNLIINLIEDNEDIVSSIINYQEIMFGLDFNNEKHKLEEEFYDKFFDSIVLLSFSKDSSKKESEIFWNLKKSGKSIGKIDSIISGILLSNGVNKIITKNKKHFENIKELEVLSY